MGLVTQFRMKNLKKETIFLQNQTHKDSQKVNMFRHEGNAVYFKSGKGERKHILFKGKPILVQHISTLVV